MRRTRDVVGLEPNCGGWISDVGVAWLWEAGVGLAEAVEGARRGLSGSEAMLLDQGRRTGRIRFGLRG